MTKIKQRPKGIYPSVSFPADAVPPDECEPSYYDIDTGETIVLDTCFVREIISAREMNSIPTGAIPQLEPNHKERLAHALGWFLIDLASIKITDVRENSRLGRRVGERIYHASLTLSRAPEAHALAHKRRLREDITLLSDLVPTLAELEPMKLELATVVTASESIAYEIGYRQAVGDAIAVVGAKASEIHKMIPVKEEEML